eukprot:4076827-Pyramimonas_sp.AAC.1
MGISDTAPAPTLAGATPSHGNPTQSSSEDATTLPPPHLPGPPPRAAPIHGSSLCAPAAAVSLTDPSGLPEPRASPSPAAATQASLRTPSRGTPANVPYPPPCTAASVPLHGKR